MTSRRWFSRVAWASRRNSVDHLLGPRREEEEEVHTSTAVLIIPFAMVQFTCWRQRLCIFRDCVGSRGFKLKCSCTLDVVVGGCIWAPRDAPSWSGSQNRHNRKLIWHRSFLIIWDPQCRPFRPSKIQQRPLAKDGLCCCVV